MVEITHCGQSGLSRVWRVLTQQFLAFAAQNSLRCGAFPQTSHSITQKGVESKLPFRGTLFELVRCGRSGLVQVQLLLAQHPFAASEARVWLCNIFHRTGRSKRSMLVDLKLIFRCCRTNDRVAVANDIYYVKLISDNKRSCPSFQSSEI